MKHTKTLLSISVIGLMLLTTACAEKAVRHTEPAQAQHQHPPNGEAIKATGMGHPMQGMAPERMEKMHQHMLRRIEQAKTPEDHLSIAAHFDQRASMLRRMARHHEQLAEVYARTDNPKMAADSARHCRNIAKRLREAAAEMQSLAKMHRQMAGQ